MSQGYNELIPGIVCDIIKHFLTRIKLLEQTSQSPAEKRPVALRNIGLNCYLNSSFQSLSACSRFVNDMKLLEHRYPTSRALFTFNSILRLLNKNGFNEDDIELSPNKILSNWNRSGEQDTFEMLSHMIFQVFNELKKINQEKLLIKESGEQFWIKEQLPIILLVEFRIQCDCGYNFKPTVQPDLALHLSVPFRIYTNSNGFTINNLLDNYFLPEYISDFSCQSCNGAKISKFIVLKKPMPNTFCIRIQRSFWNHQNQAMEKNNEIVFFEEKLILRNDYFRTERKFHSNSDYISTLWNICNKNNLFDSVSESSNNDMIDKINRNLHSDSNESLTMGPINKKNICELDKSDLEDCPMPKVESATNLIFNVNGNEQKETVNFDNEHSNVFGLNGTMDSSKFEFVDKKDSIVQNENTQKEIGDTKLTQQSQISENSLFSDIENGGENCYYHDKAEHGKGTLFEVDRFGTTDKLVSDPNECEEYYLKSVIVHFGGPHSGHYICYRKCGNKWFCTNDNFISEVTFSKVQSSQAYILMYEKDD